MRGDWVYNDANIDAAPIVWAHELGGESDQALLDYFRGRRVWLLNVSSSSTTLEPYRAARPRDESSPRARENTKSPP
jgi:hypothetical protein